MTFGENLQFLLEERDITQKDFASMLNIAKTTLNGYIKSNHEPDFETVKAMAGALHVSTDCLFKKSINLSLIEYINGVRIKAAQNLIEKSNESISDIAEKTGFMTTAHFRRVFKDATGLSPQQYRQYYKRVNK